MLRKISLIWFEDGLRSKVGPKSVAYFNHTPTFEWDVVKCKSKNGQYNWTFRPTYLRLSCN